MRHLGLSAETSSWIVDSSIYKVRRCSCFRARLSGRVFREEHEITAFWIQGATPLRSVGSLSIGHRAHNSWVDH